METHGITVETQSKEMVYQPSLRNNLHHLPVLMLMAMRQPVISIIFRRKRQFQANPIVAVDHPSTMEDLRSEVCLAEEEGLVIGDEVSYLEDPEDEEGARSDYPAIVCLMVLLYRTLLSVQ